jgi:hypothetical protein
MRFAKRFRFRWFLSRACNNGSSEVEDEQLAITSVAGEDD